MSHEVGREMARTLDCEVSRRSVLEANRRVARVMGGWRSHEVARRVLKRGVSRGVGVEVKLVAKLVWGAALRRNSGAPRSEGCDRSRNKSRHATQNGLRA